MAAIWHVSRIQGSSEWEIFYIRHNIKLIKGIIEEVVYRTSVGVHGLPEWGILHIRSSIYFIKKAPWIVTKVCMCNVHGMLGVIIKLI